MQMAKEATPRQQREGPPDIRNDNERPEAPGGGRELDFIHDVKLRVSVEFGRANMNIRNILNLATGSVVELNKVSGEPLDVRLNGKLVARGEAVIVNDCFGIRVTEIVSPEDFEVGSAPPPEE